MPREEGQMRRIGGFGIADLFSEIVLVAVMVLILISFYPLLHLDSAERAACGNPAALAWPPLVVVACLVCFALGSLFRSIRARRPARPAGTVAAKLHIAPSRAAVIGAAVLPAFLLLLVILLAYETYAVADLIHRLPITRFIRCAHEVAPKRTALGACMISFLFGHWFWDGGFVWRFFTALPHRRDAH
jgi:hypothetical protein